MVRTPFDLKKEEENNPKPKSWPEDEPWNPLSPRKEVIKAYEAVNYRYEKSVHDRACDEWYNLVKGRPAKIMQEIPQMYRIRLPTGGEYIFYNLMLYGEDWKGNKHDTSLLVGRYSMPEFTLEKDPSTDKVTTSQINDHTTNYDIPWSKEKFDELAQSATDSLSLIVYGSAGRKLGISSFDDFREGAIEDLIQCGTKGKSLESVLAEKNQFTYEKVAPKTKSHP